MVTFVVLVALQVVAQPPAAPQQECRSAFGKTACGYNCMAAFGDVKCAEHPQGTCTAAFGEIACGFDCKAAFGKVRCARAPGGVCQAAFGDVVCSEGEEPSSLRHRRRAWRTARPDPECKSAFGKTACGHHCVAAFGDVKCARTHLGACTAAFGKVTCGDPQHWVLDLPEAPPMRCESAFGKTACGYRCASGFGDVRCASTPDGVCRATAGGVACSE